MSDHHNKPALNPSIQSIRAHFNQQNLKSDPPSYINNPDSLFFRSLHESAAIYAAVLIPIIAQKNELFVLLTRRADHLRSHPGEVSFPGGRIEDIDNTVADTAKREAEEEINLSPSNVEVLGQLGDYFTLHGVCITPIVGLVKKPFDFIADPEEVADIFQVPLSYLLNPRVYDTRSHEHEGITRCYYSTFYEHRHIWGVTAGIIMGLHHELISSHI